MLIRGEPGIGKSRLAAAIAQEARDQRAVVVELAGSPFHSAAGFYPIQVLLETRCGIDSDTAGPQRLRRLRHELGASGADPDRTVPLLAPILGLAPTVGYEPLAAEGRKLNDEITSAVYDYVVACFGGGPGTLLVEDIQWLDESTLALLSRILAGDPGALFVVLTSREAAPLSVGTVVELQPLPREECLQLVDALQPDGLSSADRNTLADRSDGVPLYLEELVRGWGSESVLDREVDAEQGIPDALYEPLVARLLATKAVVVAGAAATVGRDVDRALLEALLDISTVELDRELEALTSGRILVCTGPNHEHYRFRHELLRSVAYDLQSPAKRRQVHGRAGDLLVLGAGSDEVVDWTLVATHYERAGRPNEAARAYEHASDRARQRGALAEARGRLGKSLELITDLPDGRERMVREVSVRLRRGFLAMSAEGAGSAQAASDYARCLELAMVDAQGDEMFSSLISLWAYHLSRAELARAREVGETLRSGLEGSRAWFRPANRAGVGMLDWFEGDFATARDILEAAASDVEVGGRDSVVDEVWFVPNDPTASIHTHLALARFMCGDTAGADAAMARSAATAAPLDFPQGPWSTAYGTWLRSWMLAERGEFDRAAAGATDLLELSARHGFDSWSMVAATQQAAVDIAPRSHGHIQRANARLNTPQRSAGWWPCGRPSNCSCCCPTTSPLRVPDSPQPAMTRGREAAMTRRSRSGIAQECGSTRRRRDDASPISPPIPPRSRPGCCRRSSSLGRNRLVPSNCGSRWTVTTYSARRPTTSSPPQPPASRPSRRRSTSTRRGRGLRKTSDAA